MPSTTTATLLKKLRSIARSITVTHSQQSPDTITVNHRLRRTPDIGSIRPILRTVIAQGSVSATTYPNFAVLSANASQVVLTPAGGSAGVAAGSPDRFIVDVACAYEYEPTR